MSHGMAGIGIFWCIVEMLYEENGYILRSEYERIAFELRDHPDSIKSVVENFELFEFDDEKFWSKTVLERIKIRDEKSEKARKSVEKRWNNTNVLQSKSERNTIKVNKSKVNKIKENIYSENCIFLYSMYPSTDKNNQGRSTGKCGKCKDKIEAILKTRSFEELKTVFENYLLLSEKKGSWLKNFETFLNQLPDPVEISESNTPEKYEPIDPCRIILPRRKPGDYEQ